MRNALVIHTSHLILHTSSDDLLRELFKGQRRLQHSRDRLHALYLAFQLPRARLLFRLRDTVVVAAGIRVEAGMVGEVRDPDEQSAESRFGSYRDSKSPDL